MTYLYNGSVELIVSSVVLRVETMHHSPNHFVPGRALVLLKLSAFCAAVRFNVEDSLVRSKCAGAGTIGTFHQFNAALRKMLEINGCRVGEATPALKLGIHLEIERPAILKRSFVPPLPLVDQKDFRRIGTRKPARAATAVFTTLEPDFLSLLLTSEVLILLTT